MKISYSCMPNMERKINQINKEKLKKATENPKDRKKGTGRGVCSVKCVLNGKCEEECVVYEAKVKKNDTDFMLYTGMTENTMKFRIGKHYSDFRLPAYKNCTTLSKHMWDLKSEGENPMIDWKILQKSRKFRPGTRCCSVCVYEKMWILRMDEKFLILDYWLKLIYSLSCHLMYIQFRLNFVIPSEDS